VTEHLAPAAAAANPDAVLAQRLVSLADTLVDDFDLIDLLDKLVFSCVDLLGVSAAGLLLLDRRGTLQPVASSTEATRLLELFQLQNDEGPCLDCVHEGRAVNVPELGHAPEHWARFAAVAIDNGFSSVHALPMRLRRDVLGSLNLFNAERPSLDDNELRVAQALADVATIGILQQRSVRRSSELAEQLQGALNTRIVIEQAKGVLAEYGGVGMDVAFAALRRHARDRNLKMGEVAESLVTGAVRPGEIIAHRAT
jgi:GAF domain-containing protein